MTDTQTPAADPSALPDLITRTFGEPAPQPQRGPVAFERVVRIDISSTRGSGDLTVNRRDIDFSKFGPFGPDSGLTPQQRVAFAKSAYDRLADLNTPPLSADVEDTIQTLQDLLPGDTFQSGNSGSVPSDPLPDPYRVFPSSFDIVFHGPTAVIFRSNVNYLLFRPTPFIFDYPRDAMYYRNLERATNYRQATMINAWHSGAAPNALPLDEPFNQELKIDLAMVLCVWDAKDSKWQMTPLRLDPPMQNGGGSGGSGGG